MLHQVSTPSDVKSSSLIRSRVSVSTARSGLWTSWLAVVVLFVLSRVPAIIGFLAAQRAEGVPASLVAAQQRWDGWWYLYLAEFGYPSDLNLPDRPNYGPWGFFPTWPMIIRVVSRVLHVDHAVAGLVVASLFGVALALVLRRFAARFVGDRTALVVVALFLFFPGAVVLSVPYTEAAFLFFAVAALDALVRERWVIASLAVFGACCIRSTGVAVLAAVVVQLVIVGRRWWMSEPRRAVPWLAALPLAAGAVGFALSFGYAYVRTGRPLIWLEAQRQWNQTLDFGIELISRFGGAIVGTEPDRINYLVMLASLVLFVVLVALGIRFWRVLPWPVIAYAVVLLGSVFLYSNVGPRPRMLLSIVPLFVLVGLAVTTWRPRIVVPIVLVAFAALSGYYAFAIMYTPFHVTA